MTCIIKKFAITAGALALATSCSSIRYTDETWPGYQPIIANNANKFDPAWSYNALDQNLKSAQQFKQYLSNNAFRSEQTGSPSRGLI